MIGREFSLLNIGGQELAIKLGRVCGIDGDYWLHVKSSYDFIKARENFHFSKLPTKLKNEWIKEAIPQIRETLYCLSMFQKNQKRHRSRKLTKR